MELERPEDEPLPGDWKRMPEFERLLIFRTLRPDRLTAAMQRFVANTIGKEYTASQPYDLERSFQVSICLTLITESVMDSFHSIAFLSETAGCKNISGLVLSYMCWHKLGKSHAYSCTLTSLTVSCNSMCCLTANTHLPCSARKAYFSQRLFATMQELHINLRPDLQCRMRRLAPPFLSSCPLEWTWQLVWRAWAANWASQPTLVTTQLSLWARARSPLP